jgi:diguanylate cyclase (GGDEF)-like protein
MKERLATGGIRKAERRMENAEGSMERGESTEAGEESGCGGEESAHEGDVSAELDSALELPAARQPLMIVMKIAVGVIGATLLWCAIWLMLDEAPLGRDPIWHQFMPTLILIAVLLLVCREQYMWRQPSRRMARIVEGCRAGELPIGELENVGGGLGEITKVVRAVLHDLRTLRKQTAELEAELRQRVASRTSALERQMSSLRVQATRDPLTGLHNRRMLKECLPKMIQRCREKGGELCILAIDVDNFKTLNDALGHAVGDEFLRSIAQILRSGLRESDTAIRCGGDEFIVLLPGCGIDAARALGDRLAAMVHSLAKTVRSPILAGLSVGAASLKRVPASATAESEMSAFLEAADKQLYLKKASRKRNVA